MEELGFTQKPRASSRLLSFEKRRENVVKKHREDGGRLDADAFARRIRYLREIFLDPEKRNLYQWTLLEKKVLALDWFRNPGEYKRWAPGETEDMKTSLFANLVFNYSHLAMVNIGTTVILCRILKEFVDIQGNYQVICMVVRSEVGEQSMQDALRVGFIWSGGQRVKTIGSKETLLHDTPQTEDFQCLCDGVSFNVHSYNRDEFNIYGPCEICEDSKIESRTRLRFPQMCFNSHVIGLEVTTAIADGRRNYLAAIKTVDGSVIMADITKMIETSIEVVQRWKQKHKEYLNRFKESVKSGRNRSANQGSGDNSQKRSGTSKPRRNIMLCTGCLLNEEDIKELDLLKQKSEKFTLEFGRVKCTGLDIDTKSPKGVPVRRISQETCISFVYVSIETSRVVIPMYVVAVGGTKVCVWAIGDVTKGGTRKPLMEMSFPEGTNPTDVTATIGIAENYNCALAGKYLHEPLFYTTDDSGYLKLWKFNSHKCEAAIQIDHSVLLSVDVNLMYPNMLAIGSETGKIKIYNIWKQCTYYTGKVENADFARMTTIPSYLPNNVYEYLRWYHPVVKLKWINETMLMAQYSEPLFSRESTNASTVAIWNLAKDIFDKEDAILRHRTFSRDISNSWHLACRLVCLYGGHLSSLSGVLSSDCRWSPKKGLVAISSDAIGQLHIYKPGIWTWADYDDAFCLARFKGDAKFHKHLQERVREEYELLTSRQAADSRDSMASSDLRKHRARFSGFLELANSQMKAIIEKKTLKNDIESLPVWLKKTLKLNGDSESLLKEVGRNLRERELNEQMSLSSTVIRDLCHT